MAEDIKVMRPEAPVLPREGTSIEKPLSPESGPRPVERSVSERVEAPAAEPLPASAAAVAPAVPANAARVAEIERILEEDLSELYFKLPDDKKLEFRRSGEETARQIDVLLSAASVKVKKIVDLIRRWLSIIPGINKFFLEQEAKIKTDHLLRMDKPR